MSKEKLGRYLTTLPQSFMAKVAEASLLATSAISYLDLESLVSAWHQACLLNAAG